MGLFRAFVVLLAALAALAGVLQEVRQLTLLRKMEPRAALAHYEKRRRRNDRMMLFVTIGLVLLGAGATIYHLATTKG